MIAAALLMAWIVSRFVRVPPWRFAAVALALCFVPAGGLPLGAYVRGVVGDLSIVGLAFLASELGPERTRLPARSRHGLAAYGLLTGAAFYPLAHGFTMFDPYAYGFAGVYPAAFVLAVASLFWMTDRRPVAWILLAALGCSHLDVMESRNVWDHVLDGPLVVASLVVLAARRVRSWHDGGMVRVLACLAALTCATAAEETTEYADTTGTIRIRLPSAWTAETVKEDATDLTVRCTIPDFTDRVDVSVYVLQGQCDALSQAHYERHLKVKEKGTGVVEPGSPPVLIHEYSEEKGDIAELYAYTMVRRNGVNVSLRCRKAEQARGKEILKEVTATLRADLDEWPAAPAGYDRKEKHGYTWFVHPRVPRTALKRLQKLVVDTERGFARERGKVERSPGNDPQIVLCPDFKSAKVRNPKITEAHNGALDDPLGRRLVCIPLPAGKTASDASYAACLTRLLHVVKYGSHRPYWMFVGEASAVWSRQVTGKSLPVMASAKLNALPRDPMTLAELHAFDPAQDLSRAADNGMAYVFFFRVGPRTYRKAYVAFKKEFEKTQDPYGTVERHLLSLDQDRLRKDLEKWLRKAPKPAR